MSLERPHDAHESDPELAEDVRDALAVVQEEDASSGLSQLLNTPLGRQTVEHMVMTAVAVSEERHSGPLPAPRQMGEYESIVPGGAERIFRMAEVEQQHRHEMQKMTLELRAQAVGHVKSRETRGQWIGAALALGVLALSAFIASKGEYGVAVTLAASTMVAIAAVFVAGKWRKGSKPADSSEEDEA